MVIVPPEFLEKMIDKDTEVIGVHTVDPQGLAPVSWTLRVMTGGGVTYTAYEFEKLMIKLQALKGRYKFKTIVGAQGGGSLEG